MTRVDFGKPEPRGSFVSSKVLLVFLIMISKGQTNLLFAMVAASLAGFYSAGAMEIEVQLDRPGAKINPAMWGIFFEDINFGADGGLYAEMVKNRCFEFPDPLMGWVKISPSLAHGELSIRDDESFRHQQSALCPHPFGRHGAVWTFQRRLSRHGRAPGRSLRFFRADPRHRRLTRLCGWNFTAATAPCWIRWSCRIFRLIGKNTPPPCIPKTPMRRRGSPSSWTAKALLTST